MGTLLRPPRLSDSGPGYAHLAARTRVSGISWSRIAKITTQLTLYAVGLQSETRSAGFVELKSGRSAAFRQKQSIGYDPSIALLLTLSSFSLTIDHLEGSQKWRAKS